MQHLHLIYPFLHIYNTSITHTHTSHTYTPHIHLTRIYIQVISVLLQNAGFADVAERMIFIAGHKVTSDPVCIPFSMVSIHNNIHDVFMSIYYVLIRYYHTIHTIVCTLYMLVAAILLYCCIILYTVTHIYTCIYTALAGSQPHLHPQQEAHQEPARGHAQKTGAEPTEHDGMSCICA